MQVRVPISRRSISTAMWTLREPLHKTGAMTPERLAPLLSVVVRKAILPRVILRKWWSMMQRFPPPAGRRCNRIFLLSMDFLRPPAQVLSPRRERPSGRIMLLIRTIFSGSAGTMAADFHSAAVIASIPAPATVPASPAKGAISYCPIPSPALNNLDFIVVGDNGGSLAEQTTGLPAGAPAGVERVGRQWKVNHTNAVGTTVTLTFNTLGLTTGSTAGDFSLLIDADGTGNFATAPITSIAASSYSGNIVTFTNVSLPNNAVFTFIVKDAILLPLNFLSFTAQLGANQQVNLEWQTSDETNVSHFVIERSTDGSSFTPIGQVNFGPANNYAFTDNNAVAGKNYYRIESVDNDGYTQYSSVDEVTVPGASCTAGENC